MVYRTRQRLSKDKTETAKKQLKKWHVIALVIREMQRKTTFSYHLTLVKMPKVNKTGLSRCERIFEKGTT